MIGHLIYLLGALLDYLTTRIGLDAGYREGNPVIKYILDRLPWDSEIELILLKLAVYVGLFLAGAPTWVYVVLGALQLLAAAWNFRLLRRAGVI